MNTDWKTQFRDLFYKGVERYQEGRRSPETMFEGDEPAFLESIGCSTQEMFDFCDDYVRWGDVIYEHVEEIQAVRFDYFANDLNRQPVGGLDRLQNNRTARLESPQRVHK